MQKVSSYKCRECGKRYKTLSMWGKHMDTEHPSVIPLEYTHARYFYKLLTGKDHNNCIVCGNPTSWNEGTQKYERFCSNPGCKTAYRDEFKKRMIGKHGKIHLLNDPEQQRRMLASKKTSGTYKFKDGSQVPYCSTYEMDFLRMLDRFMGFKGSDILAPSPHTYYYEYKNPNDKENEGTKFYIPDFYIPSANLEIEIKQTTNTHPKLARVDKVKEVLKDEMMRVADVNYFKVTDKTYTDFFTFIENLNTEMEIMVATEAVKYSPISLVTNKVNINKFKSTIVSNSNIEAMTKHHLVFDPLVKAALVAFRQMRFINGEILIDEKGKTVGYFMTKTEGNSGVIWLQDVYVSKAYRRCGVARQMITRAIRKYKVTNVCVSIEDTAIVDLCLKCGFSEYTRSTDKMYLAI